LSIALIHSAQTLIKPYQDSILQEYLSLLKEHVRKGNLYPELYAVIFDNIHSTKTGKSLYGIQIFFTDDKIEIQDIENIDSRRKELFLPPFWLYCKEKGFPLPESYTPKK
jgi:hypothetical protein